MNSRKEISGLAGECVCVGGETFCGALGGGIGSPSTETQPFLSFGALEPSVIGTVTPNGKSCRIGRIYERGSPLVFRFFCHIEN